MKQLAAWFSTENPWTAYELPHLIVLGLVAVGSLALIVRGRAIRGTTAGRTLARRCAVALGLVELCVHVNQGWPSRWDPALSYPFELCDLAGMAGVVALWWGSPWAMSLLYYWGLTLTIQGLLTPDLEFGFPHEQFIQFMAHHAAVVIAALYATWGIGFRPNWLSWAFAGVATVAAALWTMLFNFVMGSNYMYTCRKPSQASALDLLGEWPWYLGAGLCVGLLVWAVITVPWRWVDRRLDKQLASGAMLPRHATAIQRVEPPIWVRNRLDRRTGRKLRQRREKLNV